MHLICPTGNTANQCPALNQKIFWFTSDPNHLHIFRHPGPHRGAFRDRHERRVGMRWTRVALLTRAHPCGRRSRVVLTPRRWRQVLEKYASWERWWQESPVTKESAKETVNTVACGNAGCPGATVVTNACAHYTSRTRLRVQRAPGIPHALSWADHSGTTRARSAPREGGGVFD